MTKYNHLLVAMLIIVTSIQSSAFCGFYVAKADAKLFNKKSEVILVRDGERTVVTMSNDFSGEVNDFAMVVPVPVVLRKEDIRVVNRSIFNTLDDYSAPRLVEYYDENPCTPRFEYTKEERVQLTSMATMDFTPAMGMVKKDYQVTIEARYEVGEYEILILSAKESDGLKRWLTDNGYKIPESAEEVLDPYIKSNMKFFVAKVNLATFKGTGSEFLSPLQITFNSDRFMLPIRLGMANANGFQDMIVYALTREGRVECTNYRTVKLPTDRNIPLFVQPEFGEFYKKLFEKSYTREGKNAVFLEYAWDVSPSAGVKCDPCIGPPPIAQDLVQAGASWIANNSWNERAFFTRMHVRYDRANFPQDLFFQVTPNQERYQCRYILTHPAQGDLSCEDGQRYIEELNMRRKKEMDELVALTDWKGKYGSNYINQYENQKNEKKNWILPVLGGSTPWTLPLAFGLMVLLIGVLSKIFTRRAATH